MMEEKPLYNQYETYLSLTVNLIVNYCYFKIPQILYEVVKDFSIQTQSTYHNNINKQYLKACINFLFKGETNVGYFGYLSFNTT